MARAPRPGTTAKPRRLALKLTIDGESHTLHMADLGPQDDLISRKETGFPVTPFLEEERFGTDSIAVLWWMARRKDGETRLRFDTVAREMPGAFDLSQMFDEGRIEIEALEDGEVIDVEEGSADPLPPGDG